MHLVCGWESHSVLLTTIFYIYILTAHLEFRLWNKWTPYLTPYTKSMTLFIWGPSDRTLIAGVHMEVPGEGGGGREAVVNDTFQYSASFSGAYCCCNCTNCNLCSYERSCSNVWRRARHSYGSPHKQMGQVEFCRTPLWPLILPGHKGHNDLWQNSTWSISICVESVDP